jgi:hypothetical protein
VNHSLVHFLRFVLCSCLSYMNDILWYSIWIMGMGGSEIIDDCHKSNNIRIIRAYIHIQYRGLWETETSKMASMPGALIHDINLMVVELLSPRSGKEISLQYVSYLIVLITFHCNRYTHRNITAISTVSYHWWMSSRGTLLLLLTTLYHHIEWLSNLYEKLDSHESL